MPDLPERFQFSQARLQDFADCRRRFRLRHLEKLRWPAVDAEPLIENERRLEQGVLFHLMVQQELIGIPSELIGRMERSGEVQRWWENYIRERPAGDDGRRYPEVTLAGTLNGHPVVAQYDLIVFRADGTIQVFDWKTARRRPDRSNLAARLQTRVYPFILVQSGAGLNEGRPIRPEQVSMTYWFSDYPGDPETFVYSRYQYESDREFLASLVARVESMTLDEFEPTPDVKQCRYCVYRSLCDRGLEAAMLDPAADEPDAEADLVEEWDEL